MQNLRSFINATLHQIHQVSHCIFVPLHSKENIDRGIHEMKGAWCILKEGIPSEIQKSPTANALKGLPLQMPNKELNLGRLELYAYKMK